MIWLAVLAFAFAVLAFLVAGVAVVVAVRVAEVLVAARRSAVTG